MGWGKYDKITGIAVILVNFCMPLQRRQFIQGLIAGVTLTQCRPMPLAATQQNTWDVVIVGAGIAGLAAAQRLQAAGQQVCILEARDRLGGRIWTVSDFTVPVDLGAGWIHGVQGNPIQRLAVAAGLPTQVTDYNNLILYDTDGRSLSAAATEDLYAEGDRLLEQVMAQPSGSRDSLQAIITQVHPQALPPSLDFYLNTTIEHERAADVQELSHQHLDSDETFDGEDVLFPQGYDGIIRYLSQSPTPLTVYRNQPVQRIDYSNPTVITLETNQQLYRARAVIVTVPLGVLKRGRIVFEPALPRITQQAIDRLGIGILNKVVLEFPTVFWEDVEILNYISTSKGEWCEWLNLHAYTGQPLLVAFNAATVGRRLETWSDTQVITAAMATLRRLYGTKIPDPTKFAITRWGQDPFSYGAYSFIPPLASLQDYRTLAQPIEGRLLFAGEATHDRYPATVHGAYLSGDRAAREWLSAA